VLLFVDGSVCQNTTEEENKQQALTVKERRISQNIFLVTGLLRGTGAAFDEFCWRSEMSDDKELK